MKKWLWLTYVACYIAYDGWAIWLTGSAEPSNLTLNILGIVSILGLAFERKIGWALFWRLVSVLVVFSLLHAWGFNSYVMRDQGLSWHTIVFIQLFSLPALPMVAGLVLYAWRSPSIWSGSAQQGTQTPTPQSGAV